MNLPPEATAGSRRQAGEDELRLTRFCGVEVYPVARASWSLHPTDENPDEMNLCLLLEAGPGKTLHDDTAELGAEPSWEINLVERGLERAALVAGFRRAIPNGYEETQGGHITNFYYCEHEGTENNTLEILATEGDRMLVRMTGETVDVNYYDGSKPPTTLWVETWFVHDAETTRSMS